MSRNKSYRMSLDSALERANKERELINANTEIRRTRDINERFGAYENDPSVGGMYQRKKKPVKPKAKRKPIKVSRK